MGKTHSPSHYMRRPKERFNWRVSDRVRWLMCRWLELRAKVTGRKYGCRALAGESEYNITVNSDLTVSCNCQDYEGTGHIGDLRKNTFQEVFFGPQAQHLRDELAKGNMPIPTCARCGDLQRLARGQVPPKPRLPYRGMLLENTVRCNVDCVGCARGSAAIIRTSKQMALEELTRMADLVKELGLEQLFYLNLGEPFLSPNICEELPILRQKNPKCRIVVSTNGVLLNTDAKREASFNISQLVFSLHGIDDAMLDKYMHLGSFEKAYAAMKAMVDYRNARGSRTPVVEWKYLLFNWNDHPRYLRQAIEMAKAAGVDIISFWPTANPFYGISWRYRLGLLNQFGVKCWKGREIDFRTQPAGNS